MPGAVRSVVILGGGVAGWLAAASLARAFAGSLNIQVVESGDDAGDALLLATRPGAILHHRLGLDDRRLLQSTGATFNVGTEFAGWSAGGPFFMPHGQIGARLENIEFHQHLRRLNDRGAAHRLADYSISARAAREARFAHPSEDSRSVTATLDYGLHVDPARYAQLLRTLAMRVGVGSLSRPLQGATRTAAGGIDELVFEDGSRLRGDLYLDCSGADSRLMGQVLGVKYQSWGSWLPDSTATIRRLPGDPNAAPASRATADASGWRWQVPLQSHVVEVSFGPRETGDGPHRDRDSFMELSSGRRERLWVHNCVAFGGAGWFLEPIGGAGLQLLMDGMRYLISVFPNQAEDPWLAAEFDRLMGSALARTRDLGALFNFARHRIDALPEELAHKLAVFRRRGKLALYDEEVFSEAEWISAFIGLGFEPAGCDVLAEQHNPEAIEQMLARICALMSAAVAAMPPHMTYIARIVKSG
jgi:tryptophan halogenase